MCMKFGKEKWLSSLTLEEAGKILDRDKFAHWYAFLEVQQLTILLSRWEYDSMVKCFVKLYLRLVVAWVVGVRDLECQGT